MVYTVALDIAIFTDVGGVADKKGIGNVWNNTKVRVLQLLPPHGTYEIRPSTLTVATYNPSPTSEKPTNENVGLKIGVELPHAGEQSLCEMFTCPANGEAVEPAANVKVMFAEFCLQPI